MRRGGGGVQTRSPPGAARASNLGRTRESAHVARRQGFLSLLPPPCLFLSVAATMVPCEPSLHQEGPRCFLVAINISRVFSTCPLPRTGAHFPRVRSSCARARAPYSSSVAPDGRRSQAGPFLLALLNDISANDLHRAATRRARPEHKFKFTGSLHVW